MDPNSIEQVLIETLWNVKVKGKPEWMQRADSINRNIVDCKVKEKVDYRALIRSINRNIVECKEET